jgi:plastocyanin
MRPQHPWHRGAIGRRALLQRALAATAASTLAAAAGWVRAAPAAGAMPVADRPGGSQVEIKNFAFVPKQLTVPAGTRVVWTNMDDEAHLIASTDGAFKASPALDTDETFAMVFDKPGSYPYFCAIHPMMRGTIVVK